MQAGQHCGAGEPLQGLVSGSVEEFTARAGWVRSERPARGHLMICFRMIHTATTVPTHRVAVETMRRKSRLRRSLYHNPRR